MGKDKPEMLQHVSTVISQTDQAAIHSILWRVDDGDLINLLDSCNEKEMCVLDAVIHHMKACDLCFKRISPFLKSQKIV